MNTYLYMNGCNLQLDDVLLCCSKQEIMRSSMQALEAGNDMSIGVCDKQNNISNILLIMWGNVDLLDCCLLRGQIRTVLCSNLDSSLIHFWLWVYPQLKCLPNTKNTTSRVCNSKERSSAGLYQLLFLIYLFSLDSTLGSPFFLIVEMHMDTV